MSDIYAYLVDLSANIAQQFSLLQLEIITESNKTNALITELSKQVTGVLDYLTSEINTGIILNTDQLNSVITKEDDISKQVTGVLDYLTSEINTGIILNTDQLNSVITKEDGISKQVTDVQSSVGKTDQTLTLGFAELYGVLSQQTNDINTNTNTALSQYTNTINTNTNASVSTAVSILKHN